MGWNGCPLSQPHWRKLDKQVAVWRSGSALVLINKVDLRRARLVLGWVNVSGFASRGGVTLLWPPYVIRGTLYFCHLLYLLTSYMWPTYAASTTQIHEVSRSSVGSNRRKLFVNTGISKSYPRWSYRCQNCETASIVSGHRTVAVYGQSEWVGV